MCDELLGNRRNRFLNASPQEIFTVTPLLSKLPQKSSERLAAKIPQSNHLQPLQSVLCVAPAPARVHLPLRPAEITWQQCC